MNISSALQQLSDSLRYLIPELILLTGMVLLILAGIINKNLFLFFKLLLIVICAVAIAVTLLLWQSRPVSLFSDMLRADDFGGYFKIIIDLSAILTAILSQKKLMHKPFEYFLFLLAIVTGAHLLVMSINFVMVVLSLELISISSYALTGFAFNKKSTEGSLKYFLFGAVITAVTVYGISILYGIGGTFDFS